MPDKNYDVKIDTLEQVVIVENNRPVDAYRIYFTIVGHGQYSVDVKQSGYSADIGRAAVEKKAKEIAETLF